MIRRFFFIPFLCGLTQCADHDPQSYTFMYQPNSPAGYSTTSASVFLEEQENGFLNLTLKLQDILPGKEYLVRIYPGNPNIWDSIPAFQWPNTLATDTRLESVLTIDQPFQTIRNLEAVFVVHDPDKPLQPNNDSTFLILDLFGSGA